MNRSVHTVESDALDLWLLYSMNSTEYTIQSEALNQCEDISNCGRGII